MTHFSIIVKTTIQAAIPIPEANEYHVELSEQTNYTTEQPSPVDDVHTLSVRHPKPEEAQQESSTGSSATVRLSSSVIKQNPYLTLFRPRADKMSRKDPCSLWM
jgi:hypothetical protein